LKSSVPIFESADTCQDHKDFLRFWVFWGFFRLLETFLGFSRIFGTNLDFWGFVRLCEILWDFVISRHLLEAFRHFFETKTWWDLGQESLVMKSCQDFRNLKYGHLFPINYILTYRSQS
jgi:hypothetical protein